jgi:hypothetical protein
MATSFALGSARGDAETSWRLAPGLRGDSQLGRADPVLRAQVVDDQVKLLSIRGKDVETGSDFVVFEQRGKVLRTGVLGERLPLFSRMLVRGDALWAVALDASDVPTIVRARLTPTPR